MTCSSAASASSSPRTPPPSPLPVSVGPGLERYAFTPSPSPSPSPSPPFSSAGASSPLLRLRAVRSEPNLLTRYYSAALSVDKIHREPTPRRPTKPLHLRTCLEGLLMLLCCCCSSSKL